MGIQSIRAGGPQSCLPPLLQRISFKGFEVGKLDRMIGRGGVEGYQQLGKIGSYSAVIRHTATPENIGSFQTTLLAGPKNSVVDSGKLSYGQRLEVAAEIDSFLTRADLLPEAAEKYQRFSALLKQPEPCF